MYKSILLTEDEIKLLHHVLNGYLDKNLVSIKNKELKNLHLIDRTLLGSITTRNSD